MSGPDLAVMTHTHGADRDRESMFDSEAHRRAAWDAHRDELIADAVEREAGSRPWGFWVLDVGREDLATPDQEDDPDRARVLVAGDYLSGDERAELVERGREARARVGTGDERCESNCSPDLEPGAYPDRIESAVAELVEGAVHA